MHTPPAGQFHLGHTVRVYCNLRTVVCRQRCCRSQAYLRGMKRRGANGIRTCSLAERRGNAAAQEPHDHGQAQVRLTSVVLTHGFAPDNAQRTVQPPPPPTPPPSPPRSSPARKLQEKVVKRGLWVLHRCSRSRRVTLQPAFTHCADTLHTAPHRECVPSTRRCSSAICLCKPAWLASNSCCWSWSSS